MFIYGVGGHSKIVFEIFMKNYNDKKITFIDDFKKGFHFNYKIIDFDDFQSIKSKKSIHFAIGDNKIRQQLFNKINDVKIDFKTIIEKDSFLYPSSSISPGCFVAPKCIIGPNTKIGISSIINHNAIIDHDVLVGDFSHVAPGSVIGGGVQIGNLSLVGSNSVILPELKIGNNAIIGAGSVVTKNIPDNTVVFGNPAKKKI